MGSCLLLVAVWQSFVAVRGLALALKAGEPAAQGRRKSKKLTLIRSRLVGADWGGRGLRPERVQDWILSTLTQYPFLWCKKWRAWWEEIERSQELGMGTS